MTTAARVRELFNYDPLTGVFSWRVSPCNFIKAGSAAGHASPEGYVVIGVDYLVLKAHRVAWLHFYGECPDDLHIDHVNGCRSDNRIENLRLCNRAQNAQNLQRAYRNNRSSGILGVYFHKQARKWQAKIQIDGKPKSLGLYHTKEEAAEAYAEAKRAIHPFAAAYAS